MTTEEIMREVPGAMRIRRCPEIGENVVEYWYISAPIKGRESCPIRALRFKTATVAVFFPNGDIWLSSPPRSAGLHKSIRILSRIVAPYHAKVVTVLNDGQEIGLEQALETDELLIHFAFVLTQHGNKISNYFGTGIEQPDMPCEE